MNRSYTWVVPARADAVGAAFCSEGYNLEGGNGREDVVSTRYRLLREDAERTDFEVHYEEYKRGKFGKIDRSGTAPAVTRNTWRAADRTMSWVYEGAEGDRISISGVYRLQPDGERTRVTEEIDIQVRIPLVGERIAKLIVRAFEAEMPRLRRTLERHAQSIEGA